MDELRAVFGRFPTGVAVVTVDVGGQALGLTIGSLVRLSLEPALVGFAVSREAALHELLREARACSVSLLGGGQEALAEHFARGVPPIGMWVGIATAAGGPSAPFLAGALGWLECAVRDEAPAGTHTFFVCAVTNVVAGDGGPGLVRVRGAYAEV